MHQFEKLINVIFMYTFSIHIKKLKKIMEHSFEMPKIDSKQPCVDHPIDVNQESCGVLPDGDPNELNELKESDQTEESCQCCHVSYYFLQILFY